jgi:DNA-binding PadR family transcriptional regulator
VGLLAGYYRRVSDGALYPAIARLHERGLIDRREEPGGGPPRAVLSLTDAGREELERRLRAPSDQDISDRNRFFTLLAFLRLLPPGEQRAVLRRRLEFIEAPGRAFFKPGDDDPFRAGMVHIARETTRVERAWLRAMLDELG